MNPDIRFTIVTCTYNAQETVGRTLDSVGRQTWPHVEHLLIDGCSKDATPTLLTDYKNRNDEAGNGHVVIVRSEPDNGLYDAMNKGLRSATGDYIVFINAGDTFPTAGTLADIAAAVGTDSPLPGVLYGDTDIVDDEGHRLRPRRLQPPRQLSWHSFRHGMVVCHQAFYAHRDLASQCLYDLQYRFSADVDWCIRVMKLAEERHLTLQNLHQVVACYLDGGMTTQNHRASLRERFNVMKRHYGLLVTLFMHLWFLVRSVIRK